MAEASEGSESAQQAREAIEAAEQHLPQRMATQIAIMIGVIAFAMAALQFAQRGVQEEADTYAKMAGDVWGVLRDQERQGDRPPNRGHGPGGPAGCRQA